MLYHVIRWNVEYVVMETTTPRHILTNSPLLTPEKRLKLWQRFNGMWKNRTPDLVEELEKVRKEWDRELPPACLSENRP
jgi:hypothetical protein